MFIDNVKNKTKICLLIEQINIICVKIKQNVNGMFDSKMELQYRFIDFIEGNLESYEKVLSEFDARFGNVDIVKIGFNGFNLLSFDQATLLVNFSVAKIVAFLNKGQVRTFKYLLNHSGYQQKELKSIISKLIKANIIEEQEKNRYLLAQDFHFPNTEFISYEAKLTKWKDAISQAMQNKKFSNYSYIVFPYSLAEKLNKEEHHTLFKKTNIGLIGVSEKKVTYFIRPQKIKNTFRLNPSLISSIAKFQIKTKLYVQV